MEVNLRPSNQVHDLTLGDIGFFTYALSLPVVYSKQLKKAREILEPTNHRRRRQAEERRLVAVLNESPNQRIVISSRIAQDVCLVADDPAE